MNQSNVYHIKHSNKHNNDITNLYNTLLTYIIKSTLTVLSKVEASSQQGVLFLHLDKPQSHQLYLEVNQLHEPDSWMRENEKHA